MSRQYTRRGLMKSAAVGALVLGFDPLRRSWVTEAHAAGSALQHPPHFDGTLSVAPSDLAAAADDFGHIIHRTPVAVLRPASERDIAKAIHYAHELGVRVAPRGAGHAQFGQAQVEGGIVVELSVFDAIHSVSAREAVVDPGVIWSDLIHAGLAVGGTPPVTTDYIELSVGGTLSVGGIGARSWQYGMQVDHVTELEVVTGQGARLRCSKAHDRELFDAARAGLGQCGIITRAKIALVEAPAAARYYTLYYTHLEDFLADQLELAKDGRFHAIEGSVVAGDSGGWAYEIQPAYFYTPPEAPDDAELLSGLRFDRQSSVDMSYFDWTNRLAPLVSLLKSVGAWGLPHPWFDVFLPASTIHEYLESVLSGLTEAETGGGPVLVRPLKRPRDHAPFAITPGSNLEDEVFFAFDILSFAPPDPAVVEALVDQNRAWFEQARALGGKRYPIGAIPFDHEDWARQYGALYPLFAAAKARFDPHDVLTPGPGIF